MPTMIRMAVAFSPPLWQNFYGCSFTEHPRLKQAERTEERLVAGEALVKLREPFGYDAFAACLAARHAHLERAIRVEEGRPGPDQLRLSELKRRRLVVKEALVALRRAEAPSSRPRISLP